MTKQVEKLEQEVNSGRRIIFILIILIVALRLVYTTAGIQHEKATGKKQFQIIPYDAPLYSLYLMSKLDTDTLDKERSSTSHP